jgi:hypothetical protein
MRRAGGWTPPAGTPSAGTPSAGPRFGGRRRLLGVVVAALVALPLAVTAGGGGAVRADGEPGRFAWVETLDRGDHFRLIAGAAAGQPATLLAPQVYGRAAFSPDGRRVAYTAPVNDGSDGRYALFVVGADGTGRRQLTAPRIGDFDPAWSPDGTSIAVARDERGNFEPSCCTLWIIEAEGQGERRLAGATFARQPAYSPDGRQLVFTAPEGLRAVDVLTDSHRLVAQGALSWPAFSPDGQYVAAVRRTGGDSGTISLVPQGGGQLTDTTAGGGGGLPEAPVWGEGSSIYHLTVFGRGEDGRTRAEAVRTDVGGGSHPIFEIGRPMYYLAWTPARLGPAPVVRGLDRACPERIGEDGFADVPPDNVHERAIDCAVHWEIARGRTARRYEPAALVSREQAAGFLARAVLATGGSLPEATRDHFADDDASVHAESINRLAEAGLISGRAPGTFDPRREVSRAELAALFTRTYDYRAQQAGGEQLPPGENWFYDDRGSVHEPAINKAAQAGFTGGSGDGRYSPAAGVRRDQLAGFAARVLDLMVERGYAEVPPSS